MPTYQGETAWEANLTLLSAGKEKAMYANFLRSSVILAMIAGKTTSISYDANKNKIPKFGTHVGYDKTGVLDTSRLAASSADGDEYYIKDGTAKFYNSARNSVDWRIGSANFGYASTLTRKNKQKMKNFVTEISDWADHNITLKQEGMFLSILRNIIGVDAGYSVNSDGTQGTNTNNLGEEVDGLVGLDRAIGTGKYKGITVSDYKFWKSQNFNLNTSVTNLMGVGDPNSTMDTIAKMIAYSSTTAVQPLLLQLLQGITSQLRSISGSSKIVCVMNPVVYDQLILVMISLMGQTNYKNGGEGNLMNYTRKGSTIDLSGIENNVLTVNGITFAKEYAMVNGKYVLAMDKMYFLDMNDLLLTAEATANFEAGKWVGIQPIWNSIEYSQSGTLMLDVPNREYHSILTLNSTAVTALEAITGYIHETE